MQLWFNVDPLNPSATTRRRDDDLKAPTTVELILGFERQIFGDFSVGVNGTYRKFNDIIGLQFEKHRGAGDYYTSADYTLAKARFGLLGTAFGAVVLVGWTLLGGLDALNEALRGPLQPRWGEMAYQLALLAAFAAIGGLLELPFDLYGTFRIEQRFGFNRMTPRLYLADMAKSLLLAALIGLPLAAGVLWIMGAAGRWWWLWAWLRIYRCG